MRPHPEDAGNQRPEGAGIKSRRDVKASLFYWLLENPQGTMFWNFLKGHLDQKGRALLVSRE